MESYAIVAGNLTMLLCLFFAFRVKFTQPLFNAFARLSGKAPLLEGIPLEAWHLVLEVDPETVTAPEIVKRAHRLNEYLGRRYFFANVDQVYLSALRMEALFYVLTRDFEKQVARAKAQHRAAHDYAKSQKQGTGRAQGGWRSILGLTAGESEVSAIKQAFRRKAQKAHPDKGGSAEQMAQLNKAYAQAKSELGFV